MNTEPRSGADMETEFDALRTRLAEVEEVLRAIRAGEVDALVVSGDHGDQVYTLQSADYTYRRLVETMDQGALVFDAHGTIVYCNCRLPEMLGAAAESVLGSNVARFIGPGQEDAFAQLRELAVQELPAAAELTLQAGSQQIPVYVSVSSVAIDGSAPLLCAVVTDLTEQKRSEHILEQARLVRAILNQSQEAIVVCDRRGHIIFASREAQLLRSPADAGYVFEQAFPLMASGSPISIAAALSGASSRSVEASLALEGSPGSVHLLVNIGPLVDENQRVSGCVVTMIDITERKQAQEDLRQREVQVAALRAIVEERERIGRDLHDSVAQLLAYTRFTLHGIEGQLARGDTASAQTAIAELEEAAAHGNNDLREAIAGMRISSLLRQGLLPSVDEFLKRFQQQWGIETCIEVAPGAATSFEPMAEVQLQFIINEAMSNIRKHSEAKHARVRFCRSRRRDAVMIVDDGKGFEVVTSAEHHFGLDIMRERARLIGADLRVTSHPGRGTYVRVLMPVQPA